MKKQILLVALGLFTVTAFSQKDELKTAEKAIKKQDFTTAITAINSAEGLIANADDKLKSKFYFLKGQAFGGKKDYEKAAKAYNELFEFEKSTGRERYSDDALPLLNTLKEEVNKKAFALNDAKNYKEAAKTFYLRYTLDKKDTLFLSNAAQLALQAQDLDASFVYYKELKDLGYTGVKKVYGAIDKETNKKITFNSKAEMNFFVLEGSVTLLNKKVKIITQLISAKDECIWSKEYDYNFDDIFTIQQNVSKEEFKELKITLSEKEKKSIERIHTENVAAYHLVLKGRSATE